jgi:hypothetical protein
MLITVNTYTLLSEAALSASNKLCWHSLDAQTRSGSIRALAGRCAG